MINFNIITQNYCLNKITPIFAVAFLLSDSILFEHQTKICKDIFETLHATFLSFILSSIFLGDTANIESLTKALFITDIEKENSKIIRENALFKIINNSVIWSQFYEIS